MARLALLWWIRARPTSLGVIVAVREWMAEAVPDEPAHVWVDGRPHDEAQNRQADDEEDFDRCSRHGPQATTILYQSAMFRATRGSAHRRRRCLVERRRSVQQHIAHALTQKGQPL